MKKLCIMCTSLLFSLLSLCLSVFCSLSSTDAAAMQALKAGLGNPKLFNWSDPNPCRWSHVQCSNNRVTHIQIGFNYLMRGSLPPQLKNLSSLRVLNVSSNFLRGPVPSLAGLSSLQKVDLSNNLFSCIPSDFFFGLKSLQSVILDFNSFTSWEIPESLKDATELQVFSANVANISGAIPDFLGGSTLLQLRHLHLASNYLQGPIPSSFGKSSIQTLWLNNQDIASGLNGSLAVLQNMISATQIWVHGNQFTGPLPDFSKLTSLEDLTARGNQLAGIVPLSLVSLPKLIYVSLANNYFQGPTPKFDSKVDEDMAPGSTNNYCLNDPGVSCDSHVNILLSIAESMGYPLVFAKSWSGNDPCNVSQPWTGILCNEVGNITVVNFQNFELQGTISSDFSLLISIEQLILSNNTLTGTIPIELTSLPNLKLLDVSNNNLSGEVPKFFGNVIVNIAGNPGIGKDRSSSPGPPDSIRNQNPSGGSGNGIVMRSVLIGVFLGLSGVALGFCLYIKKVHSFHTVHKLETVVINHQHEGTTDVDVLGPGNFVISIQVLRQATDNFSRENVLGRGGFGTVYEGKLFDGTRIAIKRMEVEIVCERRLRQFKSEIAVLTKFRHRHLLALLGYCLDGNERLLVYEFMSQGTLSRHLFNWKEEGLKPLDWYKRLTIALDVARGVEYLHGLANESFIHRDLKPSNILLGDDMRAKVADFGLVRLAPNTGKHSTETRITGTFGYLAPEYVVTGRVTTKVDVFSFGVILMEIITGRKAVDETHSDPENMIYLVTWFRSFRTMHINQDTFQMAVDETIKLDQESLASVSRVAELADHCCTSEPCQRPDMGHVVNVLSSLAELIRKPKNNDSSTF